MSRDLALMIVWFCAGFSAANALQLLFQTLPGRRGGKKEAGE